MSNAVPLLTARDRDLARGLVEAHGLAWEEPLDDLVGLFEAGRMVGTAARAGYVLKMFAIADSHQGGPALGELATALVDSGRSAGHETLFVFTGPSSVQAFEHLQFRLLVVDGPVALLEHGGGLDAYLAANAGLVRPGRNGAVVVNGNPFTRGHLYLIEQASARADTLYVFVVREDRSVFPFAVRLRLTREATAHLPNVVVLDTSRYAVSAATFPSYFLRRADEAARGQMRIDLRLFGAYLAPPFGVRARFVGHEPYCDTTAAYNRTMAEVLPEYGIDLVEVARAQADGRFISATHVRDLLGRRDVEAIRPLVPPATWSFLQSPEGLAIAARLGGDRART